MKSQKDPRLNPRDELHAENNLLKLKLGLEHSMQMDDTAGLSPEVENQWLKSVYAFEQQYKDAGRIKLYEFIGRPAFKKWEALSSEEAGEHLKRLKNIMADHNVALDCICDYDDAIIYRFITEELFNHEMDDMRIPGMTTHFIYEEFHPNHDHDLRNNASEFVQAIFKRRWNHRYDEITLARHVLFSGATYEPAAISVIINTFQDVHTALKLDRFEISQVSVDASATKADVHGSLSASGTIAGEERVLYEGSCSFGFTVEHGYWSLCDFHIPGLNKKLNT